jgi:predicted Zn-dependent peptidase
VWIAPRSDSRRDVMYDRVAQPRIVRAWNVPPTTDPDSELLGIFAQVLGGSAASRLDARLVHRDQLVDSVGAFNQGMEIAGLFAITADVKSGVDPAQVERVLDEELARLLADGPSEAELARARTVVRAGFIRGVERIGGFGGKADVLAECQVFHGDPGCFRAALERISNASALAVRDAARRWLAQGDYTLSVLPFGTFTNTAASAVDRSSGLPAVTQFPDLSFPDLERTTLSNGIPVVLARRPEIPTVQVQAQIDAGYAADAGGKLGTAAFTMGMLDEGAGKLDALAFKARVEDLGAGIGSGASLDTSTVYVSALVDQLDPSLALFADVLRAPRLDAGDIERVRKQWLARIAQEKTQPNAIASRLLPPLLYGAGHSYGIPFTGSGTEASIAALTRADLAAHVATWVRPDNLRLIVVGDTTLAQIVPLLEKHFGDWRAAGVPRGSKSIGAVALPGAPRVFLVDRPEAQQTLILGGHLIPSSKAPDLLQTESAVSALGGLFSARLNMNLREAKHWSYGAYAYTSGARNQRPLLVYAPVQADKTLESLQELLREFNDYVGARPISADELARVVANDVRSLPGSFETAGAVMGAIGGILLYDRPDDWVRTLKARTEAQTLDGVRKAAQDTIKPAAMTWVIVGDLSKIEQPIRDLKLGTVQVMDADGKVLR